jgi:hypothetical protein
MNLAKISLTGCGTGHRGYCKEDLAKVFLRERLALLATPLKCRTFIDFFRDVWN